MAHTAWIGFGSNLGDKIANCRFGLARMVESHVAISGVVSRNYRTKPMHVLDQDWFVNGVVRIETDLDPHDLLHALQDIQRLAGRKEGGIRFGPRVLDLDILFFDDGMFTTDRLIVPHPRIHERRFVLQPACDIDPYWVHPVIGSDLQTLLSHVPQPETSVQVIDDQNCATFLAGLPGLSLAQGGDSRQHPNG